MNALSEEELNALRAARAEGLGVRAAARRTGIHRDTVAKYYHEWLAEPPAQEIFPRQPELMALADAEIERRIAALAPKLEDPEAFAQSEALKDERLYRQMQIWVNQVGRERAKYYMGMLGQIRNGEQPTPMPLALR